MVECKVALSTINRIITVLIAIFVAVVSVLTIISLGLLNISNFVMSIYFLLFACVMVLAEFDVKFVVSRFRLLESRLGKFLYCLLFGLLMLDSSGLRLACAITLMAFSLYNLVLMFCFKEKLEEEAAADNTKVEDLSARDKPLTQ